VDFTASSVATDSRDVPTGPRADRENDRDRDRNEQTKSRKTSFKIPSKPSGRRSAFDQPQNRRPDNDRRSDSDRRPDNDRRPKGDEREDERRPEGRRSDERRFDERRPDERRRDERRADERRPDERRPDERRPDERLPDDPDERRPDERRPDERRPDERRPDERRPDKRRPGGRRLHVEEHKDVDGKRLADKGAREDIKMQKADPVVMRTSPVYKRLAQVGEGTYGKVYKARNLETGSIAALKRLRMESERDGMPITAIREIKLLQSLRHTNIVSLREMMIEEGNVYMVFEYMDHDLAGILLHPHLRLSAGNVKFLFRQMMDGLAYLHHKGILHRDIKGSNILLDGRGNLKLADFGLARTIDLSNPDAHYTNRVITLWYRPPELLLGATVYSAAIDVWGLGCLLVELFTKHAIFQGQDEISQLAAIYDVMGTPTVDTWPSIHLLPWYQILASKIIKPQMLKEKFRYLELSPACMDLAEKLLQLNPDTRITAQEALEHSYFTESPSPEPLNLTNIGEWHDFEAKKRRRKQREERKRLEQEQTIANEQ
jgi:CTD kinase subunit alpha